MSTLVEHKPTGFMVDTAKGVVYGLRGKPVGSRNKYGYIEVRKDRSCYHAHRMVWEAAHGPIPAGLVVHHLNSLQYDNRLTNLCLVTQASNVLHGYAQAEPANLTREQMDKVVRTIGVVTADELADEFGLTEDQVHGIRRRHIQACADFCKAIAERQSLLLAA